MPDSRSCSRPGQCSERALDPSKSGGCGKTPAVSGDEPRALGLQPGPRPPRARWLTRPACSRAQAARRREGRWVPSSCERGAF